MIYTSRFSSPLGDILLSADAEGLTALSFAGEAADVGAEDASPALRDARRWLDIYFSGREPDFFPPLHLTGSPFQLSVWSILGKIPYGKTVTYGEIAGELASRSGTGRMSAQAVGGAVGHNAIAIIIPCHRVVGVGGRLTGYAAGLEKKEFLLRLEGAYGSLSVPSFS